MKNKLSSLMLAAMLFAANFIYAQAPNSFNYQAVLRDGSGNLITSGLTEMRFTIRTATSTGTVQYQETKTVTPNQFGLVNHAVGTGSIVSGTIAGVTWGSGNKFLQVEVNTGGGFVDLGTQQLVSVPYALSAGDNQWTKTGNDISNNNSGSVSVNGRFYVDAQYVELYVPEWAPMGNKEVLGSVLFGKDTTYPQMRFGNVLPKFMDIGQNSNGDFVVEGNDNARMVVTNAGRVGIGTASPTFPLHVVGSVAGAPMTTSGPESWFTPNSVLQQTAGGTTNNVSIYASAYIASGTGFVAHSDARLKNITGKSNTANDLQTLNKIEITDYTMRDSRADNSSFKKVIAQQVASVYPQAVKNTQGPDFVANLYQLVSNYTVNGNTLTMTLAKAIEEKDENDVVAGTEVKLYLNQKNDSKNIKEAVAIIDAVNGNTMTVSIKEMPSDFVIDKVFVYGTKVSNLLSVDYEAISMLNVSATQELAKRVAALEAENAALKTALDNSNTANASLKADVEVIKEQLNIRSQNTK